MLRDMARDFAQGEIGPYVEEDEKNHFWRREIFEKMAQLGFFGFCIEEKYGGNGMGFTEGVLAIEEVSKVHTSWRMAFNMHAGGRPGRSRPSERKSRSSITFRSLSAANTSAVSP